MTPHCSIDDDSIPLIMDTSVAINLIATGHLKDMLPAIPNQIVLVRSVHDELKYGVDCGRLTPSELQSIEAVGSVTIQNLGPEAYSVFESLVSGTATETLDDGEAATIALAISFGGLAILDERKARRLCAERYPSLALATSVDVFAHPRVRSALGHSDLADAMIMALQRARMRVTELHLPWVLHLIGNDRARDCRSLPHSVRASCAQ